MKLAIFSAFSCELRQALRSFGLRKRISSCYHWRDGRVSGRDDRFIIARLTIA
jgi:hypothetical protein